VTNGKSDISILIIDDEQIDRYALTRDLRSTGYSFRIIEKENGQDALDFFEDYENQKALNPDDYPPLISFLDINMPLLTGHQFLEKYSKLRNGMEFINNIVMMFTSSEREEDIERSLAYPFVKDYLIKGKYNKEELKSKIEKVLE